METAVKILLRRSLTQTRADVEAKLRLSCQEGIALVNSFGRSVDIFCLN
jgi:hypothetical protein